MSVPCPRISTSPIGIWEFDKFGMQDILKSCSEGMKLVLTSFRFSIIATRLCKLVVLTLLPVAVGGFQNLMEPLQ